MWSKQSHLVVRDLLNSKVRVDKEKICWELVSRDFWNNQKDCLGKVHNLGWGYFLKLKKRYSTVTPDGHHSSRTIVTTYL
ncbi:hypothetical protein Bpfe_018919 [Biomphalaria pfeifferi]|uniref:Uncharacterized protein n=1 Tax=Biomphalaria pfeifferi TaxID=112525 RepID=A0AAD8BBV9_BIOPF|nr:hypothetical protein Bpfe_018919 [Biomphalaria pfeifferi]